MPNVSKAAAPKKKIYAFGAEAPPRSEREILDEVDEDLRDAFAKLRDFASGLGEQRIYTSSRSIMFARDVVYLFVRPHAKYLQLTFFLPKLVRSASVKRGNRVTDRRAANVFRLEHADQVDEPLTDWLREAYAFALRETKCD